MILYGLLISFLIIFILCKYYRYLRDKRKAEKELQESLENLKEAWKDFTGLFH